MTEQEWEDYLKEHDGVDVSWDVIHQTMLQVWAHFNGETPMPDKYPQYILDNLDMNFRVLFYDIAHMKDLIINGGTVAWFTDNAARDAYYTANPDKLTSGTSVGVGDPVTPYTYDGTSWIMGALGFRGVQGDPGDSPTINNGIWWIGTVNTGVRAVGVDGREIELTTDTSYIKWRLTGEASWINLVELSTLKGADGDNGREINLRMSGTILQWQFTGDSNWQDLYDFSSVSIPAKINEYVVGANYVANDAFIDPATKYAYHVITDYTAVSIASDLAAGRIYQFGGGTVDLTPYAKNTDVTAAIGVETSARISADTTLQDNIDEETSAREYADNQAVKKVGDIMTGDLVLSGNPLTDKSAAPREWIEEKIAEAVSEALVFKGFISDTPTISDLREGNLVYIDTLAAGAPPSATFPWTGMKVFTNGALVDAPDYTPTINEEWRDRVNSETWFYSGDEWERLDFNGNSFSSDDFDLSSGEVAIKEGAITNDKVADNANVAASKINGMITSSDDDDAYNSFGSLGQQAGESVKVNNLFLMSDTSYDALDTPKPSGVYVVVADEAAIGANLKFAFPDWALKESINRISSESGTWTVDKTGFIYCEISGPTPLLYINNQVAMKTANSGVSGNRVSGHFLVVAGDVIKITGSTSGTPIVQWMPLR